jgi:hypothetical protein
VSTEGGVLSLHYANQRKLTFLVGFASPDRDSDHLSLHNTSSYIEEINWIRRTSTINLLIRSPPSPVAPPPPSSAVRS